VVDNYLFNFGFGFIVAFYFLVKRMRDHFRRQRKLEMGIIELLRSRGIDDQTLRQLQAIHEEAKREEKERNPVLWAILLLIPIVDLYVFFKVIDDFWHHIVRQKRFMTIASTALSQLGISLPEETLFSRHDFVVFLILSIVTLGVYTLAVMYMLFKGLNKHFEYHRTWEETLRSSLQSLR